MYYYYRKILYNIISHTHGCGRYNLTCIYPIPSNPKGGGEGEGGRSKTPNPPLCRTRTGTTAAAVKNIRYPINRNSRGFSANQHPAAPFSAATEYFFFFLICDIFIFFRGLARSPTRNQQPTTHTHTYTRAARSRQRDPRPSYSSLPPTHHHHPPSPTRRGTTKTGQGNEVSIVCLEGAREGACVCCLLPPRGGSVVRTASCDR